MAGISSKAIGGMENKLRFNGNELQDEEFGDGSGLELYDFNARTYDQQIGRFIQIDPMTDEQEGLSPYHFSYNNPVRFGDPDGKWPDGCCSLSDFVDAVNTVVRDAVIFVSAAGNAWASDQAAGAGRSDVDQMSGLTDHEKAVAKAGQMTGDAAAVATGVGEVVVAGSGELASVGVATPAALVLGAHGVVTIGVAARNLIKGASNNEKSSTSSSSEGRTASGQKTDQHGNKLGRSGKPQVNTVRHSTQKAAKDAARNEGRGAPVKHTNPSKGNNHYHPTDKDGNKKPSSTHHEYPK
jgi:RHS repeat-associated protein